MSDTDYSSLQNEGVHLYSNLANRRLHMVYTKRIIILIIFINTQSYNKNNVLCAPGSTGDVAMSEKPENPMNLKVCPGIG